jgi:hypothetical protein
MYDGQTSQAKTEPGSPQAQAKLQIDGPQTYAHDPRFEANLPKDLKDLVKYVLVELDVRREHHIAFKNAMRPLVEIMFDLKKWELVFAAYPIDGKLNRFVHIWRIPDETTILEIMRSGALREEGVGAPGTGNTLDDEFREVYQEVQALIENTWHRILTSLPYDPAHVGYQTHTVLIDVEGEPFNIDHNDLRVLTARDIAEELEALRRTEGRLRGAAIHAPRNAEARRDDELSQREHELRAVQGHLNRGAAVARVNWNGGMSLLFNLATLKARSVYQKLDPAFLRQDEAGPVLPGDGVFDQKAQGLLIATPWGGVYDLQAAQLAAPLLKPMNKGNARLRAALEPIITGKVPLAAVPEERADVIGDGCACYIINLNSFVSRT